ncbi:hypothetical protein EYC84_004679 [Monilinia fructicola]|uniref:Uncharacterized protein n=1 Tax=Monilinia fructicola TaxID=38448 RepID=A0A5M9K4C9_MONFR|nr:hypothetical protein EYC84_004679 [Monilinia fructicola]
MTSESNKSTEEAVPSALIAQAEAAIYGNLEDSDSVHHERRRPRHREETAEPSADAPPASSFVYIAL